MKKFLFVASLLFACSTAFAQNKGYEKSIEFNAGVGLNNSKYSFGLTMINGYRFNDHLFLGAGVGYEYLNALYMHTYRRGSSSSSYDSKSLIKLGLRAKGNLSKGNISPFLSFDFGGALQVGSNAEYSSATGIYYEPAFGVDFKFGESKNELYIMLGYHSQSNKYEYFNFSDIENSTKRANAHLFDIKVGFKF